MFYEQLKKLCDTNATSPTAVTELLGMSRGSMSNWKKGTTPNGDIIVRFAEHFNISTDYFLLGKETSSNLSNDQQELFDLYAQLDERKKGEVIGYTKALINSSSNECQ